MNSSYLSLYSYKWPPKTHTNTPLTYHKRLRKFENGPVVHTITTVLDCHSDANIFFLYPLTTNLRHSFLSFFGTCIISIQQKITFMIQMGNTVFISFISKTYFTAANIPFGIKYGHVTMNNLRFKKNMYLFALLF